MGSNKCKPPSRCLKKKKKKGRGPRGREIYKLWFTLSRLSLGIYISQKYWVKNKLQKDMHNKVPFRLILLWMVNTYNSQTYEVKRQHNDTTIRIVITLGGKLWKDWTWGWKINYSNRKWFSIIYTVLFLWKDPRYIMI